MTLKRFFEKRLNYGLFFVLLLTLAVLVSLSQTSFTGLQSRDQLGIPGGTSTCTAESTRQCPNQNGICSGSIERCILYGTSYHWSGCDYATIVPGYEPVETICDSLDNNCDGKVDGMTGSCYGGPSGTQNVGICKGGTRTCNSGSWSSCDGEVLPKRFDICGNGLDDDCNGGVDPSLTCNYCGNNACEGPSSGAAQLAINPESCKWCPEDCGQCPAGFEELKIISPTQNSNLELSEGQKSVTLKFDTYLESKCQYLNPLTGWAQVDSDYPSNYGIKSHSTTVQLGSNPKFGDYSIEYNCYIAGRATSTSLIKKIHYFTLVQPKPTEQKVQIPTGEPTRGVLEELVSAPKLEEETQEISKLDLELAKLEEQKKAEAGRLEQIRLEREEFTEREVSEGRILAVAELYCGDRICSESENENCETCSRDCGKCPGEKAARKPSESKAGIFKIVSQLMLDFLKDPFSIILS